MDCFSNVAHFIPLPPSFETANLLVIHVVRIHGIPLVSDCGPQFTWQVWKVSLTSGCHLQSNGQSERLHQDLENVLHCVTELNHSTWSDPLTWVWSDHLTWVEYSRKYLINYATGMFLFEVCPGYQPPLLSPKNMDSRVPSVHDHIRKWGEV